jgi:hypothetical protein
LVVGERKRDDSLLALNGPTERLPTCVSPFAYWDRAFLEHRQLLDAQREELVAAHVEAQGVQRVRVGQRKRTAER